MSAPILSRWKFTKSTLAIIATGISAGTLHSQGTAEDIKWNVLVLMTDMQNVHYLGCDHQGKENILTPNLDKIGQEGMIFRKAYDAYPVCAPTRASLLTGTYPFKHGQHNNDILLTEAGPQGKSPSLAHVFRDNGYNTAMFGKQHSNLEPIENSPNGTFMGKNIFHGWDFRRYGTSYFQGLVAENRTPDYGPTDAEYNLGLANEAKMDSELNQVKSQLSSRFPAETGTPQPQWEKDLLNKYPDITLEATVASDPVTYDDATFVYESLDYLETLAGSRNDVKFGIDRAKPFFLFLSLHKPHYNWVAPLKQDGTEWWYMYSARPEDNGLTYLRNGVPTPRIVPNPIIDSLIYEDPTSFYIGSRYTYPADAMQFARAKYSANISWIDHLFGKVINKLAELNDPNNPGKKMSETTIICFTTDHGDMMGEKERISKMVSYEGSARVPFLIRMPGVIAPGQQSDILLNHVDMFPTLAGLVGLGDKLNTTILDGKDCSQALLANNPALGPQRTFTVAFTTNVNSYPSEIYARSQQYKFTIKTNQLLGTQPAMLLFDMEKDPYETTNLAYNPTYRNVVIEESLACSEFMQKFYPGLQPIVIPALGQYSLTTSADAEIGSITSSTEQGTLFENSVVTLTAVPKEGYKFIGWTGSVVNLTNPLILVMNGNKTLTANFAIDDNKTRVSYETPGTGTWTVPAGVTSVTVEAWGGGGAGGSAYSGTASTANNLRAGGGAGGSFASTTASVTPGQVINYTIGAGGVGAVEGFTHLTFGQSGGSTSASLNNVTFVSALGGPGGQNCSLLNAGYNGVGGIAPVVGNICSVAFYGGNGGTAVPGGSGGGGGSAGAHGNGGNGAMLTAGLPGIGGGGAGGTGTNTTGQAPTSGRNPGGGGGGATVRNSVNHKTGATGGNGKIIFAYELTSTGIFTKSPGLNNVINVYPNPATDKLYLNTNGQSINKIQLLDLTGKIVYSSSISTKSIDLTALTNGVYFIKAYAAEGVFSAKVMKK